MRARLVALFIAGLGFLLSPSHAQPARPAPGTVPDTSEVVPLPPVTIEAARETATAAQAPFAVSVLRRPRAEVRLAPAFSLAAVLEGLPGLVVSNRSHFALGERLSVRGLGYRAQFGVRGVQVLLDGVPLTQPDGQAVLDVVEPATLRQVELVRGPSSRFWGNGAGGVLFLSTDRRSEEAFGRLRMTGGSYGRRHLLAEGGSPLGPHYVQGFASEARRDGFRAHSAGRRTRAGLHGHFRLGPATHLRMSGALADQATDHPGSLTREQLQTDRRQARPAFADANAGKRSTQAQLGLTLDHQLSPVGQFTATTYGILRTLENPLPFGFISLDRRTTGARLALRSTPAEQLRVNLSADAAFQHDRRAEHGAALDREPDGPLTLDQLETVLDLGVGAFARWDLTNALQLSAGGRLSRVRFENDDALIDTDIEAARGDQSGSRAFAAVSPSLGISYRWGTTLLFANYSTAFETPTTTELVNSPVGGGFNPSLQPQRTRGLELGTRGAFPAARLRFDVALYYQQVHDALVQDSTDASGREYFGNAGRTLHRGVEAGLTWQALTGGGPLGLHAALQLRYDAGRFTFEEDVRHQGKTVREEGNHLPGLPAHRLFASFEPEMPGGAWANLTVQAASSAYVDDANTATTDGYAVVDLQVGHRGVGLAGDLHLQPFAALQNVFDTEYSGSIVPNAFGGRYYEPAPGRHVALGLNLAF